MRIQIALHSFVGVSFEVLPVVLNWPLARAADVALREEANTIDWLAGVSRRPGPARRWRDSDRYFNRPPLPTATRKP